MEKIIIEEDILKEKDNFDEKDFNKFNSENYIKLKEDIHNNQYENKSTVFIKFCNTNGSLKLYEIWTFLCNSFNI